MENLRIIFLAFTLTFYQIITSCFLVNQNTISASYLRLCQWDCGWYKNILVNGYRTTIPPQNLNMDYSNVAFFPGYPIFARMVSLLLQTNETVSLLIAAQVAAVFFWTFFLLNLRERGNAKLPYTIGILAVLAHPANFFLVAGYSESLFLGSLLAFLYYLTKKNKPEWPAIMSGSIMGGTRIVGLPLAALPFLIRALRKRSIRDLSRMAVFSVACASGGLLFFLYCKIKFGYFDLYMQTQRIGWGNIPDFFALLKIDQFNFLNSWDRFAMFFSLILWAIFLIGEVLLQKFLKTNSWIKRCPFYFAAFVTFFVTVSGVKSTWFGGLTRYMLPWYILLVLCAIDIYATAPISHTLRKKLSLVLTCIAGFVWMISMIFFQIPRWSGFLSGQWFG